MDSSKHLLKADDSSNLSLIESAETSSVQTESINRRLRNITLRPGVDRLQNVVDSAQNILKADDSGSDDPVIPFLSVTAEGKICKTIYK